MTAIIVFGCYLALGIIALGILELRTNRIRRNLSSASTETQSKMALTGTYISNRMAFVYTLGALLLFWPMAIVGALTSGGKNRGKTGQGTPGED